MLKSDYVRSIRSDSKEVRVLDYQMIPLVKWIGLLKRIQIKM